MSAVIIELGNVPQSLLSTLSVSEGSHAKTAEIEAWVDHQTNLDHLRERLEALPGSKVLAGPRITTRDAQAGSIFMGGSISINGTNASVGLDIWTSPRIRGDAVDLSLHALSTEAEVRSVTGENTNAPGVKTNLAVSGRVLLQQGEGILFLTKPQPNASSNRLALLVSVKVQQQK